MDERTSGLASQSGISHLDCHTDPWSHSIHYFSDALKNQPPEERQLKWMYWLELWSSDRYGSGWYGPRWTRRKPVGAPYQSWANVKQVVDYIWENFSQRPHYYRWNGKPILVIEADMIGQEKPEWYERIMADHRFYVHFVCDRIHDLAEYPSNWTDWVWPFWVEINGNFNPEWTAAVSGTIGEGRHQLEGLFDKKTGRSPVGANSEPPKFILIPAYNDYVTGADPKKSSWFEPLFSAADGHMSGFQYVDQIANTLGRKRAPIDLDTEGITYSLQPTIEKLASLLEHNRQQFGIARLFHIGEDEYSAGAGDLPVLSVELYPYRAYEASKSFDTIVSMAVRNTGTAEISNIKPNLGSSATHGDIDRVWLVHVSTTDGVRTRMGEFVSQRDGIMHWVGQYPIRFLDQLLVTVDLTPLARKGRTIQFELVVDTDKDARAVEFGEEYGSRRFSPVRTIRNTHVQRIR